VKDAALLVGAAAAVVSAVILVVVVVKAKRAEAKIESSPFYGLLAQVLK